MRRVNGWYIALLAVLLWSCDMNRIYEQYEEIPEGIWEAGKPVQFQVEIKDTNKACNLFLNFRNTPEYPFMNVYVFLNTYYPNGTRSRDTLEFILLDNKGKPLGDCTGDLCDSQFKIRENVKFPEKGLYTFEIEQAMRVPDGKLTNITDVGFRVEEYRAEN